MVGKIRLKKNLILSPVAYKRRYAKDDKTQRLGDKAGHDVIHNCFSCARSTSCRDPNKAFNYRCTRYREATVEATSLEEVFKNEEKVEELDIFLEEDLVDEDSIEEMISRVITSNMPVPPDLRIKDDEIPQAKNFLQWVSDHRFAKDDKKAFPRQIELGAKLFNEFCPRCSDVEWFDEMPVDAPTIEIEDHVVFLENGVCPECKITRSELINNKEVNNYFGMILLCGQRSSKTTSAILWDAYDLHRLLKIPNPQSVYNILNTTPITSTFAATTFNQVLANVWNPYIQTLKTTPWFQNYHAFLDRRGAELGEELYHVGEHLVRYRHRNVIMNPSGPNKRTMRGTSRKTGLADEIGWFKLAKKSKPGEELELMDAKGVFDALNNSLLTLKVGHMKRTAEGYNNLPKPVMYLPSSPSAFNDFIMTSYRLYQGSTEFMSLKYATWEYNPGYTKAMFAEAFNKKPVETARDYECNPPIGESLFIREHASLQRASKGMGPNKIKVTSKKGKSKARIDITKAELRIVTNSYPSVGTILCIDVGLTNNSFAFSLIGPDEDYDDSLLPEERGSMHTPARVYASGEIIPYDETKISMTSVFADVFVNLVEPFNIKYMVSDRWNNAKIASDLDEGYGVTPIEHKCGWSDFELTRDLLYSGNLQLPKTVDEFDEIMKTTLDNYPECFRGKPIDHMVWQFLTVMEKTNVTVLKGDGTDDLFRTVVLGCAMLQDEEILEELLTAVTGKNASTAKAFVGMSAGSKGGSSQGMVSGDGKTLGIVKRR